MNSQIDVLLASQSPRRQELLKQIGVRFSVIQVNVPEVHEQGETPAAYVQRLALSKAEAGSQLAPQLPVLGADTVVVHRDTILEKPHDRAHALLMLRQLSASTHQVFTGIALVQGRRQSCRVVVTEVRFRGITPEEAELYWATGEPKDKAGAYGIQGLGAVLVDYLAGSYSNVVGLPLRETHELLTTFGVPIWCGAPVLPGSAHE